MGENIFTKRKFWIFVLLFLIYFFSTFSHLHQSVCDDEIYTLSNASRLLAAKPIRLFIPPVHELLIALLAFFLGMREWVFRLPGLLSVAAALFFLNGLISEIVEDRSVCEKTFFWTGLLYALNPMTVQGSLMIHVDNSLTVASMLLFLWCLICWIKDPIRIREYAVIFSLSGALLVKYSTPILVSFGLILFFLSKTRRSCLGKYLFLLCKSGIVFLAVWMLAAVFLKIDAWETFRFCFTRVGNYQQTIKAEPLILVQNMIYAVLWFSPFFVGLFFGIIRKGVREFFQGQLSGVLFLSVVVGCGYFLISTVNHGFPKYAAFLGPLASVLICCFYQLPDLKSRRVYIILVCFFVVFFFGKTDLIYLARYAYRTALIGGTYFAFRQQLLWSVFFYGSVFLGAVFVQRWNKKKLSFGAVLILLAVADCAAYQVHTVRSGYQVNYDYGARGRKDVMEYLTSNARPDERVIATKDILFDLGRPENEYARRTFWSDPVIFGQMIEDARTRFLVLSLTGHSRRTFQMVREQFGITMNRLFIEKQYGTFYVYTKK